MPQYSLDAPRAQINGIGDWPLVRLELVRLPGKGATIGPAAFDGFARQIVDALNAADLIDRAAEYVERFADLNGEPEGGDCREVLDALRAFSSPYRTAPAPHVDSYVQGCIEQSAPDAGAALKAGAIALYNAGFGSKSEKAREAYNRVGSAMVALNGNPLGFAGPLNPDGPEYPVR